MINDIKTSDEFMQQSFSHGENNPFKFQFTIWILSANSWKLKDITTEYRVPKELQTNKQIFDQKYFQKYPGRKLNWIFSYGTAELQFSTHTKKYGLVVTNFQLMILLCFNQKDSFTVQKISQDTNASIEDIKDHLKILLKRKILNKQLEGETINAADTITVNDDFQDKSLRVNCTQVVAHRTSAEEDTQQKQLQAERESVLETVIVRIMKGRKVMKHLDLVNDSMKLCINFKPDGTMIRRRIEALIERQYLRRDENNMNVYHYIP